MKIVKRLPKYRIWVSQYRISINGKEYKVYQSLKSYAIGKKSRMFINVNGIWYELEENEKLDIY